MARKINQLTDRKIAKLTKRGRYHDGRGLFLQITATGGRVGYSDTSGAGGVACSGWVRCMMSALRRLVIRGTKSASY